MARAAPTLLLRRWLRSVQPRHVIVGLCFLATFTAYVERVGFSIAFTSLARRVGFGEQVKGAVMSAFYWGYGVSQVGVFMMRPGGVPTRRPLRIGSCASRPAAAAPTDAVVVVVAVA